MGACRRKKKPCRLTQALIIYLFGTGDKSDNIFLRSKLKERMCLNNKQTKRKKRETNRRITNLTQLRIYAPNEAIRAQQDTHRPIEAIEQWFGVLAPNPFGYACSQTHKWTSAWALCNAQLNHCLFVAMLSFA